MYKTWNFPALLHIWFEENKGGQAAFIKKRLIPLKAIVKVL
jgi:hypothetical protein